MSRAADRYLANLKRQEAERRSAEREGRLAGRTEPSEITVDMCSGCRRVLPAPRYDGDD